MKDHNSCRLYSVGLLKCWITEIGDKSYCVGDFDCECHFKESFLHAVVNTEKTDKKFNYMEIFNQPTLDSRCLLKASAKTYANLWSPWKMLHGTKQNALNLIKNRIDEIKQSFDSFENEHDKIQGFSVNNVGN